jgi:ribosomal protein S18 acetylase RimI-like enzyme
MKLVVRKATIKDLESLHDLHTRLFSFEQKIDPLLKNNLSHELKGRYRKRLKNKNHAFFIAEADGKPVGYSYGWIEKTPDWFEPRLKGYICHVLVLKEFRGKGIGEKLTSRMEKHFKANNVRWVMLSVHAKNIRARKVWKSLGFEDYMLEMSKII